MKTILTCFLYVAVAVTAAVADPSWSATVAVKVSAKPDLKSQVESYIKRELRALHDISLSEDEDHAKYCISVVVLQLGNRASDNAGYALSTVVSSPFTAEGFALVVSAAGGDTNMLSAWRTNGTDLVTIHQHALRIAPSDGLKHDCEKLVADIDAEHFERDRQSFGRMKAMFKQLRNPPPPPNSELKKP